MFKKHHLIRDENDFKEIDNILGEISIDDQQENLRYRKQFYTIDTIESKFQKPILF